MDLEGRVKRDENNARRAQDAAGKALGAPAAFVPHVDFVHGAPQQELDIATDIGRRKSTLLEISRVPFHGMAEANIISDRERKVLWYANEHALSNEVLADANGEIRIVSWTHPGFQIALVGELGEEVSLRRHGYAFKTVRPLARARFREVLPEIVSGT